MLFNSTGFLFVFLPATLLAFFLIARLDSLAAVLLLALSSIFFYGWWNISFVPVLLSSIVVNYICGISLARRAARGKEVRTSLILGVTFNLTLLGYFKYANFFISTIENALGIDAQTMSVVLPIGISFFTFTQIAFLVDASRGEAAEYSFPRYLLFVTYFPHLVAGPILHHREMMPQFGRRRIARPQWDDIAGGITILSIGLFKKVGIADRFAPLADSAFVAAASGKSLSIVDAWVGALAYTFQLYFDFSGYSDMAIGISLLFGIRLPVNFDSPYKAVNISDFWRRWHITLSRFLREYLYVPLGGNRCGKPRHYTNLIVTMTLGGLWHGAGWTFIVWGMLHGVALVIHRMLSETSFAARWLARTGLAGRAASVLITFLFVVVAWVVFRAETLDAALVMVRSMFGLETGPRLPGIQSRHLLALTFICAAVWFLPNTQQIMAIARPALSVYRDIEAPIPRWLAWKPSTVWVAVAIVSWWAALVRVFTDRESPYLYFNF